MRKATSGLGAGLLVIALVACGGGGGERPARKAEVAGAASRDTAAPASERCSAAGLDRPAPQAGLPEPVARTREAILTAALACDYARLDSLALAGGEDFTYSFGDGSGPGRFWAEAEARGGERPLAVLVRTLALPWARESYDGIPVLYVWPSAYLIESTDEDWAALGALYAPEQIEAFREYGSFIGWRVGITEEGGWRFFVAGD